MAYPTRLLSADETVVEELRPHVKVLIVPALTLVAVCGATGFGWAAMPEGRFQAEARYALLGVAVLLVVVRCVLPWLRWRTTAYVLTTERLITRVGILARTGRDIPYGRINDVSFAHSAVERVLRCGSLVVESAGERGQVLLTDVPRVEHVQRLLYELSEDDDARRRRSPYEDLPDDLPDDGPADPDRRR